MCLMNVGILVLYNTVISSEAIEFESEHSKDVEKADYIPQLAKGKEIELNNKL